MRLVPFDVELLVANHCCHTIKSLFKRSLHQLNILLLNSVPDRIIQTVEIKTKILCFILSSETNIDLMIVIVIGILHICTYRLIKYLVVLADCASHVMVFESCRDVRKCVSIVP